MNRQYSNYELAKLTKLALGGYESFKPTKAEVTTAQTGSSTHAPVDFSAVGKNIVRPLVKNPIVQEIIDPKYDLPMSLAQTATLGAAAVPGPHSPVALPAAAGTNIFGTVRSGTQMLNNWVDDVYNPSKNPGANTQLATDTVSNGIGLIPGGKLLKTTEKTLEPAMNFAAELIKRPAIFGTSVVGSGVAQNQNNAAQTQTPPPPPSQQPQPQQLQAKFTAPTTVPTTVKTNSLRYTPPKSGYKIASYANAELVYLTNLSRNIHI